MRSSTFDNSFHGRTLATMSASGKPQFKDLFEPKVPGFFKATINDLDSVTDLISDRTVAVMIEPVQGEAGVIAASDAFLRELRELTRREGVLLIVDEIQTGMGRTGTLWGHQHAGIEPDVMTLGKMLGGGVPLAALVATDAATCFAPGDQGGTFNGNPLMTAVGGGHHGYGSGARFSGRRECKRGLSPSGIDSLVRAPSTRRCPWAGAIGGPGSEAGSGR